MTPPPRPAPLAPLARITLADLLLVLIVNLGTLRLAGTLLGGLVGQAARAQDGSGETTILSVTLAMILFQALVMLASLRVVILHKHGLAGPIWACARRPGSGTRGRSGWLSPCCRWSPPSMPRSPG